MSDQIDPAVATLPATESWWRRGLARLGGSGPGNAGSGSGAPGTGQLGNGELGSGELGDRGVNGTARVAGLDVARGLALIGMAAAHLLVNRGDVTWLDPASYTGIVNGRSSVLFATLAGVSLSILAGGRTPAVGLEGLQARIRILTRAVVIFAIGGLLVWLGPPVLVILEQYAVMFVLALPFLRWRARWLFVAAAVIALVVPLGVHGALAYYQPGLGQGSYLTYLLATGPYPALSWMAYCLAGLGVGRLAYRTRRVQLILLGAGAGLAAGGYGAAALLSGISSIPGWSGAEPHSNTSFEIVGSGGFALAVLALCLLACGLEPLRWVLAPLAAMGSMALTVYCAHVVQVRVVGASDSSGWYFAATVAVGLLAASAWRFCIGRGPIEAGVRWVSWRAAALPSRQDPREGQRRPNLLA